jgi:hypothetical protein
MGQDISRELTIDNGTQDAGDCRYGLFGRPSRRQFTAVVGAWGAERPVISVVEIGYFRRSEII